VLNNPTLKRGVELGGNQDSIVLQQTCVIKNIINLDLYNQLKVEVQSVYNNYATK
jgi:hypothetical protein